MATISGALPLLGENGEPGAPTTKLEMWWNLDVRRYWTAGTGNPRPAQPGRVIHVATVRVPRPNPCRYRISFSVPTVPPGSYPIVLLDFGGGGDSPYVPASFTVR